MTLVVATLGSAGDLHPFLAVARAAAERGERVVFLSAEPHRSQVEAQGVHFEAILSTHDHLRCLQHPRLWHPIHGFGVLWRHCAIASVDATVSTLEQLCARQGGPLRVLASPLVLGARLAADVLPLQLTTGHTAPLALRSLADPMFVGTHLVPKSLPSVLRRGLWAALDGLKLEPLARPAINAWRRHRGLPPLTVSVFGRWIHSPHGVIGFFPGDFAPPPDDWPVPVAQVGFPLYLPTEAPPADPELADFLARDESPLIVVYPGSAPTAAAPRLQAQASRLAAEGARVLLLGASAEDDARTPHLLRRHEAHLPQVLSRAHLAIHHGGIGFTAQCLATGTPQVIEASAYDQPDNAYRAARLQGLSVGGSLHARIRQALASGTGQSRCLPDTGRYSVPGRPNAAVQRVLQLLC